MKSKETNARTGTTPNVLESPNCHPERRPRLAPIASRRVERAAGAMIRITTTSGIGIGMGQQLRSSVLVGEHRQLSSGNWIIAFAADCWRWTRAHQNVAALLF